MHHSYFIKSQLESLPEIFIRTKALFNEGFTSHTVLLQKCLAQTLKIVQRSSLVLITSQFILKMTFLVEFVHFSFNKRTFQECIQLTGINKSAEEGGWGIGTQWELARTRIRCLINVLQTNRHMADSWNDLAVVGTNSDHFNELFRSFRLSWTCIY